MTMQTEVPTIVVYLHQNWLHVANIDALATRVLEQTLPAWHVSDDIWHFNVQEDLRAAAVLWFQHSIHLVVAYIHLGLELQLLPLQGCA